MAAYGNMDQAFAGLLYGLGNDHVVTGIAALDIPAGSAVFGYKGDSSAAYPYLVDGSKLVLSADLVASNVIATTISGYTVGNVTFATSHLNTVNLWVNALQAAGLDAVRDTSDATNRTVLVRKKGVTLPAVAAAITGGASQATVTATAGSSQVFLGFAQHTHKEAAGVVCYKSQDAVNIVRGGSLWVASTGTIKANDKVFLNAAGTAVAASGIALPARAVTNSNAQNLVVVELEGEMADMAVAF